MQNGHSEAVKLDGVLVSVRHACRVLRRAEAAGDGAALRKAVAEVRALLEPISGELSSEPTRVTLQNSFKEALEAIDAAERPTPAALGHVCAALGHEEADADGLRMILSKMRDWYEYQDPADRIQAESVNIGLPEIVVNFMRSGRTVMSGDNVHIQTHNNDYVEVSGRVGGDYAVSTRAKKEAEADFKIYKWSGTSGPIRSGDSVYIQAMTGSNPPFLVGVGDGISTRATKEPTKEPEAEFKIVGPIENATIKSGDQVGIQTNKNHYVEVSGKAAGGGSGISTRATRPGDEDLAAVFTISSNSAELLGLVCRVVYLMCHDHPMAAGALVRYGAAAAVVECMDLHPDDVTMQTNSLQAIGQLVQWGRGGRQVAHAMGVQHVLGTLSRLPMEPSVQAAGCVTLHRLFSEGGAPITGMTEAAVRAKTNHPEDESVNQEADALIEAIET